MPKSLFDIITEEEHKHWPAGPVDSVNKTEACACGDKLSDIFDDAGYHIDVQREREVWMTHRAVKISDAVWAWYLGEGKES